MNLLGQPLLRSQVRRLSAIAILSVLLAVPSITIVGPLLEWHREVGSQITERKETLARLQAVAAYRGRMDVTGTETLLASYRADFLSGVDEQLMAADLQSRIRAVAVERSIEFNSATALPKKINGAITFIGFRVQLTGDFKEMQHLIHKVETASPLLFVERAALRPVDRRPQRSPSASPAPIFAELDIYAAKWPLPEKQERTR